VYIEIALAILKAWLSIVTAGVDPRFTLHMSAVAVSAFNRDVQFALQPNRFRFSASRRYFPIVIIVVLLEVSDKVTESC